MGVFFLLLSYQVSFAKVAWSDEVWYVVVARNLVEHGRLNTTLYLPDAITRGGFPLRDLHLPGYMMIMALPFWLLGPTDAAALLPSQLSYLLSGVLVFWLGNRLFSVKAGYVSAAAFFAFPLVLRYTHSAMTELTLGLIALAYLVVWVKAIESPRLYQCVFLALLLFLGTLVRETFLVFFPAALIALWRWPAAQRKWAIASFLAAALFLFAGIFFPLAGHRSYYPHFWKTNLEQATIGLVISGF
jgi:4-amino-4-deoxy-L-arabinose transferase-like glycosyltransferase